MAFLSRGGTKTSSALHKMTVDVSPKAYVKAGGYIITDIASNQRIIASLAQRERSVEFEIVFN